MTSLHRAVPVRGDEGQVIDRDGVGMCVRAGSGLPSYDHRLRRYDQLLHLQRTVRTVGRRELRRTEEQNWNQQRHFVRTSPRKPRTARVSFVIFT